MNLNVPLTTNQNKIYPEKENFKSIVPEAVEGWSLTRLLNTIPGNSVIGKSKLPVMHIYTNKRK